MANHGDVKHGNNNTESEAPNLRKVVTTASPLHRHGTNNSETPRKVSRQSVGSDRSVDQSPLHPNKVSGKSSGGLSSPSWDRKNSEGNHGLAPSTPGRSRLKSIPKGNETPDNSPAVPKFGDWDENDPNSAEGFTQIFELVRVERHNGAGNTPNSTNRASYQQYGKDNPKVCGCFPWCGK